MLYRKRMRMNVEKWFLGLILMILFLPACVAARVEKYPSCPGSVCPVHTVEMKRVPVIYGYPDESLLEKAKKGDVVLGGCIIRKENPQTAYVCPVDKKVYCQRP